jgi:hypothetical protein
LGGNLNYSPKFYLANVFMNVNLYGLTYMQKFEDITQVVNELDLISKEDLNLNTNLNHVYTVVTIVTLEVSQPTVLKRKFDPRLQREKGS